MKGRYRKQNLAKFALPNAEDSSSGSARSELFLNEVKLNYELQKSVIEKIRFSAQSNEALCESDLSAIQLCYLSQRRFGSDHDIPFLRQAAAHPLLIICFGNELVRLFNASAFYDFRRDQWDTCCSFDR